MMTRIIRLLALLIATVMVFSACAVAEPITTVAQTISETEITSRVEISNAETSETTEEKTTLPETEGKDSEKIDELETEPAFVETDKKEEAQKPSTPPTTTTRKPVADIVETDDTSEIESEEIDRSDYNSSMSMSIDELKAMITFSNRDIANARAILESYLRLALHTIPETCELGEGTESEEQYESDTSLPTTPEDQAYEINLVLYAFENKYFEINTQFKVLTLIYYYDMSDEKYSALYLEAYSGLGEIYGEYVDACKQAYENSPLSEYLFADWSDADIASLYGYDPEIQRLRDANEALLVELNALEIDEEYNDKAAEIYAKLVTNNNKLAKLYGFENYYEYASVCVYGRDYSEADTEGFAELVRNYFGGNIENVYAAFEEKLGSITENGYAELLGYLFFPFDYLDTNYLDLYIRSFGESSTGNSFADMFEKGNVLFSDMENSHPSAFQTYISGEGWNKPVCFFGSQGQDTSTVVHEMGHYYAALFNSDVYSYDLAEVQSQANEMLLLVFMSDYMSEDTYNALVSYQMYNYIMQIGVCTMIDEFERAVYSLESVEGFGSEEFDAIMASVCEKYGGIELVSHYYTDMNMYWRQVATNNPVYYISYSVSMIEALNIFSLAQEDSDAAREIYRALVEDVDYYETLLTAAQKIGLSSPFDEQTFIDIINAVLGE